MASRKEAIMKYTAHYRCPDDIQNFKIRIKYKEIDEDKIDTINEENNEIDWETKVIFWQEKLFSKGEREFYEDPVNCTTDTEKKYHEQLKDEEHVEKHPNVFTYTEEDGYNWDHEIGGGKMTYLQSRVDNSNNTEIDVYNEDNDVFDYSKSVQSAVENSITNSVIEKMYIIADLGEYVENVWIKNEQLLCSLKFDKNAQVLSVYPDFTTTKPYCKKVQTETIRYFCYLIENCSPESEEFSLQEQEVLKKIFQHKQSLKQRIIGDKFTLPPKDKLHVYLFLEILSGKKFEYPDITVEYYIDLPEGWSCENPETLNGRTQTSRGVSDEHLLHFGHCLEVTLHYDIKKLNKTGVPKTPYIYFEVISQDNWERCRTEGLTYKNLPIAEPGCHFYNLSCFRFTQGVWGNLRRFFIGDCKNYKDVTWIGIPKEHEHVVINKFGVNTVGTGELNVRMHVVHQSSAFLKEFGGGDAREKFIYEKLNCSSLVKSVEEVLQAFRKARKKMLEVRKDL